MQDSISGVINLYLPPTSACLKLSYRQGCLKEHYYRLTTVICSLFIHFFTVVHFSDEACKVGIKTHLETDVRYLRFKNFV